MLSREGVVRMHLNGEAIAGENEFHQQRKVRFKPDFSDLFSGAEIPRRQILGAPNLFQKSGGKPERRANVH
jgi:hypothetical protein